MKSNRFCQLLIFSTTLLFAAADCHPVPNQVAAQTKTPGNPLLHQSEQSTETLWLHSGRRGRQKYRDDKYVRI